MPNTEPKQAGAVSPTGCAAGTGYFPTDLLDQVRSRFHHVESDPVMGRRIYFESAGGSLALRSAVGRAAEIAARPDNAGRDNASSRDLESIMARGREDVELFLGARSGQIISGESSTANVFRIVEAMLKDQRDGNVVTTLIEHPCTYGATKWYARRCDLTWRVAPIAPQTGELTPESISDRITSSTKKGFPCDFFSIDSRTGSGSPSIARRDAIN